MIDHNVSQTAKILQRSRSSIKSLIMSGKLDAYDAAPDGRLRQWRITPEALEKFRNRNKAKPPESTKRRRIPKPTKQYV